MIDQDFLSDEVEKTKQARRTSTFLRELVLRVVDRSLAQTYGSNYSVRCLQSSVGVQFLLESFGIKSRLVGGAACLARATKGPDWGVGWAGFWDKDHHYWLLTEWGELVDLTVSQLHLHPASSYDTDEAIPAIWWDDASVMPAIIKYLPASFGIPIVSGIDDVGIEQLKGTIHKVLGRTLKSATSDSKLFTPILHGVESLNAMLELGNPWLVKSLEIERMLLPHPPWIVRREQELMEEWERIQRDKRRGNG